MKPQSPPQQQDIYDALKKIEKLYDVASLLANNEDVDSSVVVAFRLASKMHTLISTLQSVSEERSAYLDVVMANKMQTFKADLFRLKSICNTEKDEPSFNEQDYLQLLSRLGYSVSLLKSEIENLYPNPSLASLLVTQWKIIPPKRKKGIFTAALLILVVGSIWGIFRYRLLKRSGIYGEYYTGNDFGSLLLRRWDPNIDFDWGYGPVVSNIKDNCSVRWSGFLRAPMAGPYEFRTSTDDGVRLWVDDHLIIDDWHVFKLKQNSAKILLAVGFHRIKVEYFENKRRAVCRLAWRKPGSSSYDTIQRDDFVWSDKYFSQIAGSKPINE